MKALLLIDMPKDCIYCPVAHYNKLDEFTGCDIVGGKKYAMTTEKGYKETSCRPSWCPLKPLPQKKDFEWADSFGIHNFKKGFNACLDEILGEKEEKKNEQL